MEESRAAAGEVPALRDADGDTSVASDNVTAPQQQPARRRRRRPYVLSVDDERIEQKKAESLCKRMFFLGCLFLPLFWLTNFWLFWPYFRGQRHNQVIEKYCKYSFFGFAAITPIFLAWFLTFAIGYDRVFTDEFVRKFDASRLNLRAAGWAF